MTLKNTSEVKPTTIHADTQGQSYPVFAIAHLLGIDLMPRIRNWKDLLFFRPSRTAQYEHIDALFGEAGRNVIDWRLIETHFRDLMRVIVSIREGAISSVLLLRRLRSGSRRNATYTAFREVGKVIRTVQLLRYLSDAPLRARDIADVVRELQAEGRPVDPLGLAQVSPYLTEHIKRFGEYSIHELGITPDDYDARLDVDFSVLGDDDKAAAA
ncbi:Tn3 family transposase [Streptomyces sp. NPDC002164]|uniref:Tn3 family transposase n=1 Tax=unclassified Streptomyces TaxID=2593676 RepID=UPI0036C9632E